MIAKTASIMIPGLVLGLMLWLGGLTGCSNHELTIHDAWIPAAPPRVPTLAGYMTIENGTEQTQTLVGASGALFQRIEIHRTVYDKDDGLARMIPEARVTIPSGRSVVFKPGGYHLMLTQPKRPLKEGERVPIQLLFADGSKIEVGFQVRKRERLRP
jgi:hypothetical protein